MSTTNALKTQITTLETKVEALEAKMKALEASLAKPSKSTSSKKAKDPDAPKQEPNWWLKATQYVRGILKPRITELNSELPEGGKKIPGTAPVAVTKILKDDGKISSEGWEVSEELVMEAFAIFRKNIEDGSVASKATSKASSKAKFADLSDEEKASKRSEAAKKAAATRKANKAKKDAEVVEVEVVEVEVEEALEANEVFKHKGKTYMKAGNELRTPDGEWVGLWDAKTKTIDVMAEEP